MNLSQQIQSVLLEITGAKEIIRQEMIQSLWSNYGGIFRCEFQASQGENTLIVKHIKFPDIPIHPRGWNTPLSHARKVKSYEVEMNWYRHFSRHCNDDCRVASCLSTSIFEDERTLVLEDLDEKGFSLRYATLDKIKIKHCLSWLANFHARFMGTLPEGLWDRGTYWHIDTRPDELSAMPEGELKTNAMRIAKKLDDCQYQTLVHGDAKVANFCFSDDETSVAAVDFQYVGAGCGMKDVAYLIGSCLTESECDQWQDELLDFYFETLKSSLERHNKQIDWKGLQQEWTQMYAIAWTDFYRFLSGWMPDHPKFNTYGHQVTKEALETLGSSHRSESGKRIC